jgi:hypothetical protein
VARLPPVGAGGGGDGGGVQRGKNKLLGRY